MEGRGTLALRGGLLTCLFLTRFPMGCWPLALLGRLSALSRGTANAHSPHLISPPTHHTTPTKQKLISLFVAVVPVVADVAFKFWVYKYLRKLSPGTQIIMAEMECVLQYCTFVPISTCICTNFPVNLPTIFRVIVSGCRPGNA